MLATAALLFGLLEAPTAQAGGGSCTPHAPRGVKLPAIVLVAAERPPGRPVAAGTAVRFVAAIKDPSRDAAMTALAIDRSTAARGARVEDLTAASMAVVASSEPVPGQKADAAFDPAAITLVALPRTSGDLTLTVPPLAVDVTLPEGVHGVACTTPLPWKVSDPTTGASRPRFRSLFLEGRIHDGTPLGYLALFVGTAVGAVFAARGGRRPRTSVHIASKPATLREALVELARRLAAASDRDTLMAVASALSETPRAAVRRYFRTDVALTFRELAEVAREKDLPITANALDVCAEAEDEARFAGAGEEDELRAATAALLAATETLVACIEPLPDGESAGAASRTERV